MTDRPTAMTTDLATHAGPALAETTLTAFVLGRYDRLLGLARLVCRDVTDASDAVQAGLEQAWRRRDTLRDGDRLRPWLDRIVVREAIRIAGGGHRGSSGSPPHRPRSAGSNRWLRAPTSNRRWRRFANRSHRLPADQRAVVALHHHLGYSVAETAGIVGAPVETVRTRLRRATDRLRRDLEEGERSATRGSTSSSRRSSAGRRPRRPAHRRRPLSPHGSKASPIDRDVQGSRRSG